MDSEEPTTEASDNEIRLPILTKPYSDAEEPSLAKPRKLMDDPKEWNASTLRELPRRPIL
jgi:hypothetical protein